MNLLDRGGKIRQAYAIDPATTRTALATAVDHHVLERWGSLIAASFLAGYGQAVQASHTIGVVGPFGNVVAVPQGNLDHADIALEALGTVGQRLADAVAPNFNRPNTVRVEAGTGIGVLVVAPSSTERATATAADHREASPDSPSAAANRSRPDQSTVSDAE